MTMANVIMPGGPQRRKLGQVVKARIPSDREADFDPMTDRA